jgi:adenine-specific DNA-methyltransferase
VGFRQDVVERVARAAVAAASSRQGSCLCVSSVPGSLTGSSTSSSPDDIACWFIDSYYNEESFFVRHAYFTGADEPYKKLQRALKAEIDEDAWSNLYSTVSRPFEAPSTGKIAVKVINHYGDEVLKMYEVAS